jgi:hypothetical protein
MMIGGPKEAVAYLDPVFSALAPGLGEIPRTANREKSDSRAERGYIHAGPSGAGHFVKMVHNGIEYGMMQAYAEGFDILRNKDSKDLPEDERFVLDMPDISEVWRRGSVISSWLLDLSASALAKDPELARFSGYVQDSGEGRWTVEAAIEEAVPANILMECADRLIALLTQPLHMSVVAAILLSKLAAECVAGVTKHTLGAFYDGIPFWNRQGCLVRPFHCSFRLTNFSARASDEVGETYGVRLLIATCVEGHGAQPELRLAACSEVIEGNKLVSTEMALVFLSRAALYKRLAIRPKQTTTMQRRSIASIKTRMASSISRPGSQLAREAHGTALKLDPRHTLSLHGRGLSRLELGNVARGNADRTAAAALDSSVNREIALYGLEGGSVS